MAKCNQLTPLPFKRVKFRKLYKAVPLNLHYSKGYSALCDTLPNPPLWNSGFASGCDMWHCPFYQNFCFRKSTTIYSLIPVFACLRLTVEYVGNLWMGSGPNSKKADLFLQFVESYTYFVVRSYCREVMHSVIFFNRNWSVMFQ